MFVNFSFTVAFGFCFVGIRFWIPLFYLSLSRALSLSLFPFRLMHIVSPFLPLLFPLSLSLFSLLNRCSHPSVPVSTAAP